MLQLFNESKSRETERDGFQNTTPLIPRKHRFVLTKVFS